MPELKPCPFCGGHVQFVFDYKTRISGIYCSKCQMKADFVIKGKYKETYGEVMERWAEKWNRREVEQDA